MKSSKKISASQNSPTLLKSDVVVPWTIDQNANNRKLKNLGNPTEDLDAVHKRFVEEKISEIEIDFSSFPAPITETMLGVVDNLNRNFSTSQEFTPTSLIVFVNGLEEKFFQYVNSTTIRLNTAPSAIGFLDKIECYYTPINTLTFSGVIPVDANYVDTKILALIDGALTYDTFKKVETILTNLNQDKVSKIDIYNALDCLVSGKVADARQLKVLNDMITALTTIVSNKQPNLTDVNFGSYQSTLPTVTSVSDTDKIPFLIGSLSRMMTWANFKGLFKTINSNSIFGSGNIITPDMDTTTTQTVSGIKTFLDGKFGLRNTANTFTSFFASAVTGSRTWTLPDKNGTVAMTSDIVEKLSGGVSNYLIKFNSATTGVLSRIIDTGTYLGIGTTNTPTKDITLGNQANRTIGVEESDNTTPGREFIRTAGRTINYANSNFVSLNITSRNIEDYDTFGTDMYAVTNSGQLLKQTNSTGDFVPSGASPSSQTWRFVIDYAFNFYFATWGNNNLYKQAGASGTSSIIQTFSSRINALALNGNDLYIFTQSEIYIQTNLTGAFVALGQSLNDSSNNANACSSPTGNVYYIVQNVLYKRTGSQGLFVNTGISATAIHITPNNNVYISAGNKIHKQINEAGAFIDLNQVSRAYFMLGGNAIGNVYCNVKNSDTYLQQNYAVGIPNLDGGTLKDYAGTGKGVGKSRIQRYTGQKTASGTDMQIDTLREEIDENGHYLYFTHPIYANDTEADADSNLRSKAYYKITGNRGIFQKP